MIFIKIKSEIPIPKPLPLVEGLCMPKGSASCRAFWHTRPASVPGLLSGAAAPATLLGASPQTPFIFFKGVFLQSERSCFQLLYNYSFVEIYFSASSIAAVSASVKSSFSMQATFSAICSGLLAPISTVATALL